MASVVIVTGLSGSGKTTALRALEDVGYFCLDNLPAVLLPKVLELAGNNGSYSGIAVVIDAREPQFLKGAGQVIDELRHNGTEVKIVFLDANDTVLLRRFREVRRRHPLEHAGQLRDAVERERDLLEELSARADVTIDTSDFSVHDLKNALQAQFGRGGSRRLRVQILSFGFKHGLPSESDLVFDVRFLRNPAFVDAIRDGIGLDSAVADYVLAQEDCQSFLTRITELLHFLLPRYLAEGKVYLTVAVGCTGGRHRSVAIAEALASRVREFGFETLVRHRDDGHWKLTAAV